MSQRKFFVGGNWKMNGTKESIKVIADFMNKREEQDKNTGWFELIGLEFDSCQMSSLTAVTSRECVLIPMYHMFKLSIQICTYLGLFSHQTA